MKFRDFQGMPPVGAVMTSFPYSVRPQEPLREIERLMSKHQIRHMPVQEAGRVVGVVSERDLRLVKRASLRTGREEALKACDLAREDPYVVEFETPLDEVVKTMADRRIGSAIVIRDGTLAGIVSVVDVCRVLAGLLEHCFSPTPRS